jgi:DNA invertase Pin-like site-specific DNA recombinase/Zn finger protein HypA/HybF involved in hydrogenase expression
MKYFIYCRKSSEQEDRQILSLPAQQKELTDYAERESLQIVDVFLEAQSAHKIGRAKFNEMLNRIDKSEADGFLVWDESRIARNSLDGGRVIYMMDLGLVKEIRKIGKKYTNTPDDKSWLAMCFMMSKKESDDKGVNVKRGLRTKAESGWYPSSWTKVGYMWDRFAERGNKTILKDPERFPLMKKAWELMISGAYTPPQILHKLNEEWGFTTMQRKSLGGKKMWRSRIYEIFTDPFYYGEYRHIDSQGNETFIKGKHEPMITKEEFDRVQILLGRDGKPRPKTHNFPFTGAMRCGECNAMITAEEKWQVICTGCKYKFDTQAHPEKCPKCATSISEMTSPTLLHYQYYHCTKRRNPQCSQRSIAVEKLEKQIDELLGQITISEKFKDWAIKYLNELNEQEKSDRNNIIANLQKTYNDGVQKLDNLIKLKISPTNTDGGLISDEEFKVQKDALMKDRRDTEERIKALGIRIENWVDMAEKAFDFACHARFWFANGDLQTKKEIVVALGQNLTIFNKTLLIDLEKPLNFIEKAKKEADQNYEALEPAKKTDDTLQLEASWSQNLALLPRRDSNPQPCR